GRAKPEDIAILRGRTRALQDSLLTVTGRAIDAGARLVVWSEMCALVLRDDEPALTEKAHKLATDSKATICMGLGVLTPGARRMQNKAVVVGPDGSGDLEYLKSHPVPGDPETGGPRMIPHLDTTHGRIATAICFDLDFPSYLRQAGRTRADLLLVPAKD